MLRASQARLKGGSNTNPARNVNAVFSADLGATGELSALNNAMPTTGSDCSRGEGGSYSNITGPMFGGKNCVGRNRNKLSSYPNGGNGFEGAKVGYVLGSDGCLQSLG